ncbi:type II toxin-antitoxin system RelE family toxin [Mycobacterium noviomagense]|uniref:Plasmid stabilization protein n=1 Tax=Mycobacterium noviomagense TaxID=459858 RepID=A0A7I7PIF9_9MYCO|nr:type II toxin-antitoxin system RelE/ParE family toxin [Mycobacterium noviomagense]ORB17348.1 hypothetical protein BST37_03915 [Mycobacterium noviomagense]BBY08325.1 hypothetical protein MNVI_36430 [Mycobacterium noviomagense]
MRIAFHPDVLKQLQHLPRDTVETALHTIIELGENPRPVGAKKLVGTKNEWRIRFGQYRIVYHIDDEDAVITVFTVVKRSDAYR